MKTIFRTVFFLLLLVTIKVNGQTNEPTWSVSPLSFDFDGEITAEVFIDKEAVVGGGILGAFVGDECRGVKRGGLTGPAGKYVFIIRCYSNLASGETMSFKYYDPVGDTVYEIRETIPFEPNMIVGTAFNPTPLNAYKTVVALRELLKGWSWISINVESQDNSIGSVLGSLTISEGDYIKNQIASATWYNGIGWFGELSVIDPREMYKIKLASSGTLRLEGYEIDPATAPISIKAGWNWIGFIPLQMQPVGMALTSIDPAGSDYIKNQTISSTFYTDYNWFGELTFLQPLDGYMLRSSHPGTLVYPGNTMGYFADSRDSRMYKWVTVGKQTWMAENQAYLPAVSPPTDGSETEPFYYVQSYFGSSISEAKGTVIYNTDGVLYNWPAALAACPTGWHLPSEAEFQVLEKYLGMSDEEANTNGDRKSGSVGGKLKITGTERWISPNTGATNETGFSAIPAGHRFHTGNFYGYAYYTDFWTTTAIDATFAMYRRLFSDSEGVYRNTEYKIGGISVRCLLNK
jgi:uncharacterized protein (TIGR02145 family)